MGGSKLLQVTVEKTFGEYQCNFYPCKCGHVQGSSRSSCKVAGSNLATTDKSKMSDWYYNFMEKSFIL